MPLDTHRAFKRLQEDDVFTPEQAERITETLADLDVASATKEDLDDLEERLSDRIDQVEDRFDQVDERFDRVDERFDRIDERTESMEERLTQRNELTEERLNRRIEQAEKRLLRWMIAGLSAVAALLGALIGVIGL